MAAPAMSDVCFDCGDPVGVVGQILRVLLDRRQRQGFHLT
jgi:hypothetical protein